MSPIPRSVLLSAGLQGGFERPEGPLVFTSDVLEAGPEHLVQRPAMADEVDQEGQCHLAGQALLLQEESHVVQVPGVLTVEGGHQLARVEVWQGQDRANLHLDLHRPGPGPAA